METTNEKPVIRKLLKIHIIISLTMIYSPHIFSQICVEGSHPRQIYRHSGTFGHHTPPYHRLSEVGEIRDRIFSEL